MYNYIFSCGIRLIIETDFRDKSYNYFEIQSMVIEKILTIVKYMIFSQVFLFVPIDFPPNGIMFAAKSI